jgi:radical SAM protein with 4Fe4S-binding SPASM domain
MKEELVGDMGGQHQGKVAREPKNTTSPQPAASIQKCTSQIWGTHAMERIEPESVLRQRRSYRGEQMSILSMQHIPLTHAYLCQDCNSIGNCAQHCPACASEALMGLSGVLNRKSEDAAEISYSRMPALAA